MKSYIVGRNQKCDIVIQDKTVSSNHLKFTIYDKDRYSITDLNSSWGTLVNGKKIEGEYFLNPNDVVQIGKSIFNWENYINVEPEKNNSKEPQTYKGEIISLENVKHPKENFYFWFAAIFSGMIWLNFFYFFRFFRFFRYEELVFLSFFIFLIGLLVIFLVLWIINLFFESKLYANSVNVNKNQYPELYEIVKTQSKILNFTNIPKVFIYNGNGYINAFAIKYLSKRHIILMSSLVDLMLANGKKQEIGFVIGHELGHHFAKHLSLTKKIFLLPSKIIPFLGAAYSRACELTADRIGYVLINKDIKSSQNALINIASGSEKLSDKNNIEAFIQQDYRIPGIIKLLFKLSNYHPRLTRRVIELQKFHQ